MTDLLLLDNRIVGPEPKQIVRLSTTYWKDARGLHCKKSILFLRRKSQGVDYLDEDADCVGSDETFARIVNFYECEDGIYMVAICNESRDWETGIIDDYDFKLVPVHQLKRGEK